jgi:DNA-binding response OmpR family regulator
VRILIIEDEEDIANAIAIKLRQEGYAVDLSFDGEQGLYTSLSMDYDLVILDLNLPLVDGLELCQQLRAIKPAIFILILTARADMDDIVQGLDRGADDYLGKPFHMKELTARIRSLLRRDLRVREPIIKVRDLQLDPAARSVMKGIETLKLTVKEYALLEYLMRHPGEVISQTEIIDHIWDDDVDLFRVSVRVHIHTLRTKLGQSDSGRPYIETLIGQGYRLMDTV